MKTINKLLATIVATLLIFSSSVFAADKHKFKMATSWGGGPLMEIGAKAFAENVKRMSNGRIQIEVFPSGTLGPGLKVSETVKNGLEKLKLVKMPEIFCEPGRAIVAEAGSTLSLIHI